jgi:hypothetical protein
VDDFRRDDKEGYNIFGMSVDTFAARHAPGARCSFCVIYNGTARRTDKLKLVTVKGRDYLACYRHRGTHERSA